MDCPGEGPKVIIKDQSLACRQTLLASLKVELTSLVTVQNAANCEQFEYLARVVTKSSDFAPNRAFLHANLSGIRC